MQSLKNVKIIEIALMFLDTCGRLAQIILNLATSLIDIKQQINVATHVDVKIYKRHSCASEINGQFFNETVFSTPN